MSWIMVAGAAVTVGSSMISNNSAKKAASQKQAAVEQNAKNQLSNSQEMFNRNWRLADEARAANQNPGATVDNGYATSTFDPATGQATSSLNAPWQAQRDMFMNNAAAASGQGNQAFGMADMFRNQAKDFNVDTFAKDRYAATQALMAPQRAQGQASLMQDLLNKGGYGLQVNQAAGPMASDASTSGAPGVVPGTGNVAVNPYVQTFMNTNNAADANMAYQSQDRGQSYLDSILGRYGNALNMGGNMFNLSGGQAGFAGNIQNQTQNSQNNAMNISNMFNTRQNAPIDAYYRQRFMGEQGLGNATNNYFSALNGNAQNAGAGAMANSAMWSSIGSGVGGAMMGSPNAMKMPTSSPSYVPNYGGNTGEAMNTGAGPGDAGGSFTGRFTTQEMPQSMFGGGWGYTG